VQHRFPRVEHQSVHDLLDLNRVDFRFPKIDRDIEVCTEIGSVKRKFSRMLQEFPDGDHLFQRRATLGKGQ
jgi:hypothetical protein